MKLIRDVPQARRRMLEKTETQYKSTAYESEIDAVNENPFGSSTLRYNLNKIIEFRQTGRDGTRHEAREA